MIPREGKLFLLAIWACLLIGEVISQGERAYDTSEWIPITPKPVQASGSEIIEQKTASDRVLSLDAPAQKFYSDDEHEYRQRRPNQVRQVQRELPPKNGFEHPRPRKLKHPSEYKFETPPPPPLKNQPEINYYNGENMSPYTFEQTLQPERPINQQQNQQAYYVPVQQLPKQNPAPDTYVPVPSVNPQVPAVNAPSHYEKFQLPFNNSFYESLSPASINNDFYQAVSNHSNQQLQSNFPVASPQLHSTISTPVPKTSVESESVQLVYVPVENLKQTHSATQDLKPKYQNVDAPKREKIPFPVSSPQIDEISLTYKPLEQLNYKPLEQQTYKTLEQSSVYKPLEQPNYKPLEQSVYKPIEQSTYKPLEKSKQEKFIYNTVTLPQNQKDIYSQQVDNPRQEKLVALPPQANVKQQRLQSIEQDFIQQALQAHKLQQQLRDDINPLKQDLTANTDKPKRKPHQPPLAVFLESHKKAEISDVLNMLKGAKTISVQDAVTPQSPQIFVGPSNLDSPDGYTKFPLPYLNNINGNRIERKIDQLPFFVAPVSYKAPPGYSKISLPSPHVGSVVVSIPVTSTTPAPIFHNQNQLNPFTFSSPGYSPLDPSQSLRPQENILDNYDILDPSRNRYQSTPTSQVTDSPLIPPVRDVYESAFEPRQPNIYYTQPQTHQTYSGNVPPLDIYRPQIQEKQIYPTREETPKPQPTVSAVNPKEDSRQHSQLPDLNPLELAINEFELHQINDQFEEHNKVKHSTTRRPQTNYDVESISNTRSPQTRGRHTYETDPTTERTVTRGRVRGRGRGSVSRTTTTTTTTTAAPAEVDKYTVLEEFVAREPSRAPTTETYSGPSAEAATQPSRRPTTSFSANPYLPQEHIESVRPHTDFRSSRPQIFDVSNSPSQYENPREEIAEQEQPKRQRIQNSQPQASDDPGSQIQYKNPREELAELEQSKGQSTSNSRPQLFEDSRSENQYENPREETADFEPPIRQPTLPVKTQKSQVIHQPTQVYSDNVEIESFPANAYNLGQSQTYENTDFESPRVSPKPTKQVYENIKQNKNLNTEVSSTERPKLEEATPTPTNFHRFSPEPISYENREPNQRRTQEKPNYQQYEVRINNDARDVKPVFQTDAYQQPPTKVRDQVIDEPKSKPKQQSEENLSGFIDNLFQPNFDQTYISLQDQAVRSLLVPNLLAPSVKQISPSTSIATEEIITAISPIIEIPSSTEAETTTTTRATRTRGRGRARPPTTPSSVTSATRRSSSRRRPVSRTSGERVSSSTEHTSREDNGRSGSNVKQKFKTRGRPTTQNEISDRVSTTENDVRVFKEPTAQGGFEASREPPQSYMQFEHSIDGEQIITINPNLNQDLEITQYQQLYNIPQQTTTESQVLEYDNTRVGPSASPILDVQVSHVVPDDNERRSEVSNKANVEEIPSRYHNANIKSGGVLINNKPEAVTKPPPTRARGRARGRSRFATGGTSTSRPVTRISTRPTSVTSRTTTQKEEKEIYGFTRQPTYTPSNLNIQAPKASLANLREDEPSIQFVGEIRPKYNHRLTTAQPTDELDAVETPKTKTRTRTRAPTRKTSSNYRQSDNDVHTARGSEVVTRRSGTATRTRGGSHYRAPENVKRESDDEDVANQNYPANFLQKLDVSSAKPTTASFQITIDPLDDETDDQSPYSSLYRPKFIPKPNEWFDPNGLSTEDKSEEISKPESTEAIPTSKDPQALAFIHTTENSQQLLNEFSEIDKVMADLEKIQTSPTGQGTTTKESGNKKETRRRGAWKLVKQRPVDQLEVSESQNYQTVLNAFDSIKKTDSYSKSAVNSEKSSTNSNYSNKNLPNTNFKQEINNFGSIDNSFKNDNTQEDIEDILTITTNSETKDTEPITETITEDAFTTVPSTTKTQENIFDTIYEMFGIFDKQKKNINETSLNESVTSNVATTTVDYPTFPEEMTEVPTTTTTEEVNETSKIVVNFNEKNNNQDRTPFNGDDIVGTTETTISTTLEVKSSTKPYEVEPWKMREVKTSTSTEVSHETEICYKGRCVKSKDKKKRT